MRGAIAQLKTEYGKVMLQISNAEHEKNVLAGGHIPFEDLKSALIEHVIPLCEEHAKRTARLGLSELVTSLAGASHGRPPTFKDVTEKLRANVMMSAEMEVLISNSALYYFCGELARAGVQRLLDELSPSDFGYNRVIVDQIGPSRAERVERTTALDARLVDLKKKKQGLSEQLAQFGVSVEKGWAQ